MTSWLCNTLSEQADWQAALSRLPNCGSMTGMKHNSHVTYHSEQPKACTWFTILKFVPGLEAEVFLSVALLLLDPGGAFQRHHDCLCLQHTQAFTSNAVNGHSYC